MAQKGSIDKGMFNFDAVMKEFYNMKPDKDDTENRAIKNNFQANMIQSGFDAQLAKDMAYQQSSIAQSNMITAADLEARNTSIWHRSLTMECNPWDHNLNTRISLPIINMTVT